MSVMLRNMSLAALATTGFLVLAAAPASAQSCQQLWHERNAIYARNGYCFETPRARAVFGPGCFPPYGQLSGYDRQRVNEIQAVERMNGC